MAMTPITPFGSPVAIKWTSPHRQPPSNCSVVPLMHHLVQRALGARMQALGQLVEDVGKLVTPAALLADLRPDLAGCGPEAQRTITDGEHFLTVLFARAG